MPPVDQARLHTPGICATSKHHCTQMHDQLLHLCQEHLTIRLKIPEGTKVHKADTNSVGHYSRLPKFSDLENWLINVVIMLQAIQYGGDDRDQEHMLCIPEFLDSEAKKWYS